MGGCFARCLGRRDPRRFARSVYYDQANSVEFESLMDEMPRDEPLSPDVITEFEKAVVSSGNYKLLLDIQNENDVQFFREAARQEEMLELEEEAFIDARQEASRIARLEISNKQQIINPVRLLLRTTKLRDDDVGMPMSDITCESDSSLIQPNNFLRVRGAALNRGFVSDPRSRTESTCSSGSVDLEWEHEAGFYYGNSQSQKTEDEVTATATAGSEKCATPQSTDFEWDDGFNSPDLVDLETEQLIQEIEMLTSQALKDPQGISGENEEEGR